MGCPFSLLPRYATVQAFVFGQAKRNEDTDCSFIQISFQSLNQIRNILLLISYICTHFKNLSVTLTYIPKPTENSRLA